MRGQRILVTGASGFIGAAVCEMAAASGREVIGLCRDPERGREKLAGLGDAATLAAWDMSDPLPRLDGVDAVIHAAGRGDPASFAAAPATVLGETLLGCRRLLDFAA
ncbi:MAG: NAD-dependent epimerase/dehydratase family protein, partial [Planctomycetota bacterium]|nr:NAD-dependent epimerase/dehydratase family protein [Planctomycetota bacterium]